jgi:hypothetical protein
VALLLRLHQIGLDEKFWKEGRRPMISAYQVNPSLRFFLVPDLSLPVRAQVHITNLLFRQSLKKELKILDKTLGFRVIEPRTHPFTSIPSNLPRKVRSTKYQVDR